MTETAKLKQGQKIDTKIIDDNVELHPEISKWRDAYTVDLQLLNSLKTTGQIQNSLFRPINSGKKYQLISGTRRYLHQKLLGTEWEDIPKTIKQLSDREAYEIAASENFFRQDLNKWEEVRVIYDLLTRAKIPVKELSERLGVSEDSIKHRRTLMKLSSDVRKKLEKMDAPIGYAEPLMKLSKYPEAQMELVEKIEEGLESRWEGVDTIEEAEDFVIKVLKRIEELEEMLKKYGPCPVCNSKKIEQSSYRDEDKLLCRECDHSWHKETKEPWEYYRLKQEAEELGLEITLEAPGEMKVTPKQAAEILKQEIEEKKQAENIEEEDKKEDKLAEKFRSWKPLETILAPVIEDNIQKITFRGEEITIELIENPELYFKGLKKIYKSGEQARIEVHSGGYSMDFNTQKSAVKVHDLMNRVNAFQKE